MSDNPMRDLDLSSARQLDDRFEHHTPKPAGTSATVETTHDVRVTTPQMCAAWATA